MRLHINSVDPEVLLTDYSMVFQDVVLFDDTVMENIRLGKHGATDEEVLVIAHRMRTVEAADKIVVLVDGKVVEEGSPGELLKKENGIFRHMTQLQTASAGWSI